MANPKEEILCQNFGTKLGMQLIHGCDFFMGATFMQFYGILKALGNLTTIVSQRNESRTANFHRIQDGRDTI